MGPRKLDEKQIRRDQQKRILDVDAKLQIWEISRNSIVRV